MARSKSSDNKSSRYSQGGITEAIGQRLGWWERDVIQSGDDDIFYQISAEEEGRPDLVAYKFWRQSNLMWLVLQYNDIVDINEEFKAGNKIKIPSYGRVISELTAKSTGAIARAN